MLLFRIKSHHAIGAVHPSSRKRGGHQHRTVGPFISGGDVQGMNTVMIDVGAGNVGAIMGKHIEIKGAAYRINDRRGGDAHFGVQIMIGSIAVAKIVVGHHSRNAQIGAPQQSAICPRVAVGVKRVNAVVLRGHIDDVMHSLTGNGDIGHDQRFRVHLAIYRVGEQLAETVHIDVAGRQYGFIRVRPIARVVVVICQHGHQWQIGSQRGEGLGRGGPGDSDIIGSGSREKIDRVGGQTRNRCRK